MKYECIKLLQMRILLVLSSKKNLHSNILKSALF